MSPRYRALASLIRTFLETAVNPKFRRNHYHALLYRYHVLEETALPDPGFPPYYSAEFFSTIKKVKDETPLNVATMTTSQWSRLLIEDNLTMTTLADSSRMFTPCKAEILNPSSDWELSWHLVRLKGLGPDHSSFLWKLVHQLLPVKARLHRLSPSTLPLCTLCKNNLNEDMIHSFFSCTFNQAAGQALADVINEILPNCTNEKMLRLEFGEMEEELEFPVVWFTAAFLLAIWERRSANQRIRKYQSRNKRKDLPPQRIQIKSTCN